LYNTATINLEILIPGKVIIPHEYKKAAIRYNNSNIANNPDFSYYLEDNEKLTDKINTDSIASEIYFQVFAEYIKKQHFFDTVIEIESFNYHDTELNDSLVYLQINDSITTDSNKLSLLNPEIIYFTAMINRFSNTDSTKIKTKYIDPEFGLYSKQDIQQIADSTDADMLLSFDYFASVDEIHLYSNFREATEIVYVLSNWNFYDLKKQELTWSYRKTDTIKWIEPAYNLKEAKRVLPPRQDAVFNAADIAGTRFAEFLVPHWIDVARMYYQSGHLELKETDDLIKQNRWMEAAKIWRKNTTNSNKSIAAKSMFNMALACEINGEMDAAIDWAVKSFYVFGSKNQLHAFNCQEYIRILSQRKLDIQKIENLK
jgi:hypothetical protein